MILLDAEFQPDIDPETEPVEKLREVMSGAAVDNLAARLARAADAVFEGRWFDAANEFGAIVAIAGGIGSASLIEAFQRGAVPDESRDEIARILGALEAVDEGEGSHPGYL